MSEVIIRRYRRSDRQPVLDITEESFGGFCMEARVEEHFGPIAQMTWQQRKAGGIDYDLRCNPEHTLVAERDEQVVGYICNRVYRDQRIGHIANLAVALAHQGQGIGKMLISAALAHLRDCGMRYARIETLESNARGCKLYPSFGFKEVGRQVFFMREL
ncbi:MAG: GNAT family N-acetyltransferase [Candidatus Brocadiaceae bacterium]|nr:GNAT family N-acetyltransferase [Candidatus Brocadiaceae bacterium]